jgi:uncharacterized protein with PhoU and TrkA domain
VRLNSVALNLGDVAINKSLGEFDLEGLQVVVNAVRRHNLPGNHLIKQPSGYFVMHEGDVLMMQGQQEALLAAEKRLRNG